MTEPLVNYPPSGLPNPYPLWTSTPLDRSSMTQQELDTLAANRNPYTTVELLAKMHKEAAAVQDAAAVQNRIGVSRADLDKKFETINEALEAQRRSNAVLDQRLERVAKHLEQSLQEKPTVSEERKDDRQNYVYCKACHNTEACHAENMAVVEAKKQEALAKTQADSQEEIARAEADSKETIARIQADTQIQVAKLHGRMNSGDKLIAVAFSCLAVVLVCVIVVFGAGNIYGGIMEKRRAFENGYEQQSVPNAFRGSPDILWVKTKTLHEPKQPDMKLELPDHGAR